MGDFLTYALVIIVTFAVGFYYGFEQGYYRGILWVNKETKKITEALKK